MIVTNPMRSPTLAETRRSRRRDSSFDVSVLVPAKDEAENLPLFMEQAAIAFGGDPKTRYEVVVIDDGSVDDTPRVLRELETQYSFLHVVTHRSQRGIADALRTGYLHARGDVLVFYPADLQFKPEDIPRLVAPVLTLGNFDGVHRGHQAMLALLASEAAHRGLPATVLTMILGTR